MLSARMDKGSSSPYSLSEQEAQSLFRRHFPFVPLPYQLETKLTSQVMVAVQDQYHYTLCHSLKTYLYSRIIWLFRPATLTFLIVTTILLAMAVVVTLYISSYLN